MRPKQLANVNVVANLVNDGWDKYEGDKIYVGGGALTE